jgi:preprotein translocase subunit SecY
MAEIPQNSFQGPLAPKIGLNDNMRNPLPGGGAKIPKKRNYSGLIPVGALALALLILPLTIQQLSKQQDTRQQASQPTPTIVLPTQTTGRVTVTPGVRNNPTPSVSLPPEATGSAKPSFAPPQ